MPDGYQGCIGGSAPPFIILSIAFASTVWIPTFYIALSRRMLEEHLSRNLKIPGLINTFPSFILFNLVVLRILAYGQNSKGTFWTLDYLVLFFTSICFGTILFTVVFAARAFSVNIRESSEYPVGSHGGPGARQWQLNTYSLRKACRPRNTEVGVEVSPNLDEKNPPEIESITLECLSKDSVVCREKNCAFVREGATDPF